MEAQEAVKGHPEKPAPVTFDVAGPVPDVFADSVQIGLGPYGMSLTLGLTDPDNPARRTVVGRVRLSPQLAMVMTQLMRKILKKGRDDGIGSSVPPAVLRELEIDENL